MPAEGMPASPCKTTQWRVGTRRALIWTGLWLVVSGLVMADVRFHGQLIQHDEMVAQWIHEHATAQAAQLCGYVTQLGSLAASLSVGILVALWLILKKRWGWLIWWILALCGGGLCTDLLKRLFARPRPIMYTFFPPTSGFSFPSGHTIGATILIGMLAYLIMRLAPRQRERRLVAGLAVCVTLAVAGSLVYIGVHFVTDVLAGLALGWAWLGVCILGLEREGD